MQPRTTMWKCERSDPIPEGEFGGFDEDFYAWVDGTRPWDAAALMNLYTNVVILHC